MRGLSGLQKSILACLKDRQGRGQILITVTDLLGELWEVEDKAGYNQAHASLSRALTRLWQRGLVEIWKTSKGRTGVTLADPPR